MLSSHLDRTIAALHSIRPLESEVKRAVGIMAETLQNGGRIYSCGNGGSAAESAHFATELLCRLEKDRPSLPAMNLSADGSFLTATGNDYGFERIFARQIEGLGRKGDVLVAFSTSGKSPNILEALETARTRGLHTVSLLGRDGGPARALSDVALIVPVQETMHIQEGHQALLHVLCGMLETAMFPNLRRS